MVQRCSTGAFQNQRIRLTKFAYEGWRLPSEMGFGKALLSSFFFIILLFFFILFFLKENDKGAQKGGTIADFINLN